MKKFKHFIPSLVLVVLILPAISLAQSGGTGNTSGSGGTGNTGPTLIPVNIPNPTTAGDNILDIIIALLRYVVMPIAAVLVVLYIIYAGFTFVTAQGKPAEIDKAKQRLLWALIGAGILLGAAGIAQVVKTTVCNISTSGCNF